MTNVGTLVEPTSRAQYLAQGVPLPVNLFSHSDQQAEWQNAAQSTATSTGWAGRIADSITITYRLVSLALPSRWQETSIPITSDSSARYDSL